MLPYVLGVILSALGVTCLLCEEIIPGVILLSGGCFLMVHQLVRR
jgi:hypothetical protein